VDLGTVPVHSGLTAVVAKRLTRALAAWHKHGEGVTAVLTMCLNSGLGDGGRPAMVSK
jgi:hypothetical protein